MRRYLIITLLGFTLINSKVQAQQEEKPYTFMIGLSWNAIDDDGDPYGNLFNVTSSWNMFSAPASLSVDYYLKHGMSTELIANFNRYKKTNIVNGETDQSGLIFNIDLNFKYSFGSLMKQPYFDPFIFVGIGHTMRPITEIRNMFSPNVGVGFNLMLAEDIGIQFRTAAKISVHPVFFKHESNYLHHHAGIIYRFGSQRNAARFGGKKHRWTEK